MNFKTKDHQLNREKKFPWHGVERMRAGTGGLYINKREIFSRFFLSSINYNQQEKNWKKFPLHGFCF